MTPAVQAGAAAAHGLPQFDPEMFPAQIFWEVITFLALLELMRRFVIPRIRSMLAERENEVKRMLDEAARHRAESERLMREHRKRLAQVEEEAARMLREAEKRAAALHADAMQQLEEDIRRKKQALWADIEFAKRQALKELHEVAAEAAVMAAGKFIEQRMDRETAQRLVADAIRDLERNAERSAGQGRRRLN